MNGGVCWLQQIQPQYLRFEKEVIYIVLINYFLE